MFKVGWQRNRQVVRTLAGVAFDLRNTNKSAAAIRGIKLYFFEEDLPGLSFVIVPFPNFCVLLLDPSERFVSVPVPNFCVVPVTVLPPFAFSVVIVPFPNFCVLLVDPSDRFVSVPLPNFCVVPVRALLGESPPNNSADKSPRTTAIDASSFVIFVFSVFKSSFGVIQYQLGSLELAILRVAIPHTTLLTFMM